jgi:predicted Rossmann fold flavoprotein
MIWDVAIAGAGAAGLMAAIGCRRQGLAVLLLDSKEKIGAKILMSGGTRCNVTNQRVSDRDFETETRHSVRHVLAHFSPEDAVRFFRGLGVRVIPEAGGKFFPSTHSARTVLNALLREIMRLGVRLEAPRKVTEVRAEGGVFTLRGAGFSHRARNVILATGGLSYPGTGSDGSGYPMAQSFGHSLIPTSPALTPLVTDDLDWKQLTGISLPVRLTLRVAGKIRNVGEGDFLFTHFGFSGPSVLDMSRHWIRSEGEKKLEANFLPAEKEDAFRTLLAEAGQKTAAKSLRSFLAERLPERLVETLLAKHALARDLALARLKREDRERLLRALFHAPLSVTAAVGYVKAEVTAGGVDFREVDASTLESKLQPGLFFAGEILDVDGHIGGYNFQWAWASGVVAARGVAKRCGRV